MTYQPPVNPPTTAQGTGSLADVVTALQGIIRHLSAWVQAFQGRVTTGSFTMPAAATATIAQPAVLATSEISLQAVNASAATLTGSSKSLYILSKSPGVSFTVKTGDATNAAGTESFTYLINSPT